jgi:hypothetical protein
MSPTELNQAFGNVGEVWKSNKNKGEEKKQEKLRFLIE